ncbi:MAG: reverse transcriptase-like protein [Bacteroidales bacterium]
MPNKGLTVDASHLESKKTTEYRGVLLETGEEVFRVNLGHQTTNIGEFLGLVHGLQWIIETGYEPKTIYCDSTIAISWFNNKRTSSTKKCNDLRKAEIFLQLFFEKISEVEVVHWNNKLWGEIPADFDRK